jgi:hypothetical protein
MPILKREEVKQLSEPIIIEAGILGEKEYRLSNVTAELMKKIQEITPDKDSDKSVNMDTPIQQLALLLGVSVGEFSGVDMRVAGKVLDFISSSITEGIKNPNPSKAGAK